MWEILASFPVLGLALMLQVAVFSRMTLLSGSADVILLILAAWGLQDRVRSGWVWAALAGVLVAFTSGLPWYIPLAGYLLIMLSARVLRRRVWQAPLLAMFLVTFTGTLLMHASAFLALRFLGDPLPAGEVFNQIILPGVLLNLFLGILVYPLIRDLAVWLCPGEVD